MCNLFYVQINSLPKEIKHDYPIKGIKHLLPSTYLIQFVASFFHVYYLGRCNNFDFPQCNSGTPCMLKIYRTQCCFSVGIVGPENLVKGKVKKQISFDVIKSFNIQGNLYKLKYEKRGRGEKKGQDGYSNFIVN